MIYDANTLKNMDKNEIITKFLSMQSASKELNSKINDQDIQLKKQEITINDQDIQIKKQEATINNQDIQLKEQETTINDLKYQLAVYIKLLFGKKSEKEGDFEGI